MASIETRHCETAVDFVKLLRRSNPYWLADNAWRISWIFRGQSNDEWPLVPSAWRGTVLAHDVYKRFDAEKLDNELDDLSRFACYQNLGATDHPNRLRRLVVQHRFELFVAYRFAELVDELGLPLPGAPLPNYRDLDIFDWEIPGAPLNSTIALAQHHGTQTRLLDWTHNPLVAAFFAAERACSDDAGNIVVWAVNRRHLARGHIREFTVERGVGLGLAHISVDERPDRRVQKVWPRVFVQNRLQRSFHFGAMAHAIGPLMFRFTIRDLLWLMVVVACLLGWWNEYRKFKAFREGGIMFYLKPPAATK